MKSRFPDWFIPLFCIAIVLSGTVLGILPILTDCAARHKNGYVVKAPGVSLFVNEINLIDNTHLHYKREVTWGGVLHVVEGDVYGGFSVEQVK